MTTSSIPPSASSALFRATDLAVAASANDWRSAQLGTKVIDTRRADFPDPLNQLPIANRLPEVRTVLRNKQLAGGFVAHLKNHSHREGVVRIAVVDDFSAG